MRRLEYLAIDQSAAGDDAAIFTLTQQEHAVARLGVAAPGADAPAGWCSLAGCSRCNVGGVVGGVVARVAAIPGQ